MHFILQKAKQCDIIRRIFFKGDLYMKKILAILLAVGILLSFAACGKDEVSSGAGSEISSGETESAAQNSDKTSSEQTSVESEKEEESSESSSGKAESSDKTSSVQSSVKDEKEESSKKDSSVSASSKVETPEKQECAHKYSDATCTAASKCTLCGAIKGTALGHSYSAGKCSRCAAIDSSYATYSGGGKDSIIRTTAGGKTTTLKIDISKANERLQNISFFGEDPSMEISYSKFFEVDGWLFFAQTINLKYTVNGSKQDIIVEEVFKIKIDGTSQTALITTQETEEKGVIIPEIFGFDGGNVYYVLENEDEGTCEIYKAPVSTNLTNLIAQGKKIASSPTEYATIWKCSLKGGFLYFSEKLSTYDMTISAPVSKDIGNYKMNLDGTGLTKLS